MRHLTFTTKQKSLTFLSFVVVFLLFQSQSVFAQKNTKDTISVEGKILSDEGPLQDVNIILENSTIGTVSKKDGTFKFPKSISKGDVLIFSYLGFKTQRIKISDANSILDVKMMYEDMEMIGALNSNKPYRSVRKN